MTCSTCGSQNDHSVNFCRNCGSDLGSSSRTPARQNLVRQTGDESGLTKTKTKDPDELTGNGIGSVIVGDGFFIVAVLLSATHSSVSSLLWLFLLIPAFFFFGKGFADVLHAKQIRRRLKQEELTEALKPAELLPPLFNAIKERTSGELFRVPSVTERTTRELT